MITSNTSVNNEKPMWLASKDNKVIDSDDYIKARNADINRLISEMSTRLKTASPERLGQIEPKLRARNNFIERL